VRFPESLVYWFNPSGGDEVPETEASISSTLWEINDVTISGSGLNGNLCLLLDKL
jgi:hypothetical protein